MVSTIGRSLFTNVFFIVGSLGAIFLSGSLKLSAEPAFQIGSKVTSIEDIKKNDQAGFFELEKRKYGMIEQAAQEQYLEQFWKDEAKAKSLSIEGARKAYFDAKVKVSDEDVKSTLDRYKDSPELKGKSTKDQEARIREELKKYQSQMVEQEILRDATATGKLKILVKKPVEPKMNIAVTGSDFVRYGPSPDDTKPMGCEGNACPITIVEYSEFECPFCSRVMPTVAKLLTEYKGKIRWTMRDFPLDFHKRARPAAVAAKCAGEQGKFWHMYKALYDNQQNLQDSDFEKHAQTIGLNMGKFKECVGSPAKHEAAIDANIASGAKYGVRGTPAFFVNGRMLSGAQPYDEFKRVIEDELASSSVKKK